MARTILVVEDNPAQAEHVRWLLKGEGYQVQLAANGRDGLQLVQSAAPDLIMSDVGLPEMDGYTFCRAVKSAEATKRKSPIEVVHGLEIWADNFITKPFEDGYLLERVRRIFEHREFRQKGYLEYAFFPVEVSSCTDRQAHRGGLTLAQVLVFCSQPAITFNGSGPGEDDESYHCPTGG